MGEVAAAYLAGALDLDDAVRVIFHRGRTMDFAAARGKMLAVALPVAEAQALVEGEADRISIAALNSVESVTLSGDAEALARVAARLDVPRRVVQAAAGRLRLPQRADGPDEGRAAAIAPGDRAARSRIAALLDGHRDAGERRRLGRGLLVAQRPRGRAVRSRDRRGCSTTATTRSSRSRRTRYCSTYVDEIVRARGKRATIVHSLRRGDDEQVTLLKNLGKLYAEGVEIDAEKLAGSGSFVELPAYAWEQERFWDESEHSREYRLGPPDHPLLGRRVDAACPTWECGLDPRVVRYLADHRVQGLVVLSGTSYLEMALAAVQQIHGPGPQILEEIELVRACFLAEQEKTTLQLSVGPSGNDFAIHRRPEAPGQPWTLHVSGRLRLADTTSPPPPVALDELCRRCDIEQLSGEQAYTRLGEFGLDYGPSFRLIARVWRGRGEAVGRIVATDGITAALDPYQVHPALLDAAIQVVVCTIPAQATDRASGDVYLPVAIDQVRVHGRLAGPLYSHARIVEKSTKSVVADVRVLDESGQTLVEIRGLRCRAIDQVELTRDASELVYAHRWQLAPRAGSATARRLAEGLPTPAEIVESTVPAARALVKEFGLENPSAHPPEEMNRLCTAFLLEAFGRLGVELQAQERFTAEELADRLGLADRYRRLMTRYLEILEQDGVVRRDAGVWQVVEVPPLPEADRTWRELMAANPAFYAELTLLGRCGLQLDEILRGDIDPLHLIFPDGSLAVTEHLYQDSPFLRFYNTLAQAAVARIARGLPQGRSLRVLEIGAGTGGLTSYVLPKLPADRVAYVYTDLSNHFFNKAREKFQGYPFLEFKRLDIEQDPLEQGFEPHSFDLILASECLHATADLRATCENVLKLLASDGLILLLEAVEPVRWVDLVFGLTDGWWRFTDTKLRPDYPLLSLAKWKDLLEQLGFRDVRESSGAEEAEVKNAVILARGPRTTDEPAIAAASEATETPSGSYVFVSDRGGVAQTLANELRTRGLPSVMVHGRAEWIGAAVVQAIRETARKFFFTVIALFVALSSFVTYAGPAKPWQTIKLKNGLEIIVIENPAVPLVTVEIAVKNGAYTEPPEYNGLSHLYEHMFFKSNERSKAEDITTEPLSLACSVTRRRSMKSSTITRRPSIRDCARR